jgi:hypothetical protein
MFTKETSVESRMGETEPVKVRVSAWMRCRKETMQRPESTRSSENCMGSVVEACRRVEVTDRYPSGEGGALRISAVQPSLSDAGIVKSS